MVGVRSLIKPAVLGLARQAPPAPASAPTAEYLLANFTDGIAFDFALQSYVIKTAGVVVSGDPADVITGGTMTYSNGGWTIPAASNFQMALTDVPLGATATSAYWEGNFGGTADGQGVLMSVGTPFTNNGAWALYSPAGVYLIVRDESVGGYTAIIPGENPSTGAKKCAARIKADDFACTVNGEGPWTDTAGEYPTPVAADILRFGGSTISGQRADIRIDKLVLLPEAINDATLLEWSTNGIAA